MKATETKFWMALVSWVMAAEWLKSGWDKWAKPDYMDNIGKTLGAFSAKTPHRWYGDFLKNTAQPNPELFGNIVRTSEVLIGVGLLVGAFMVWKGTKLNRLATLLLVVACYGAAVLNLNFYWAAGWSSPSTEGINLVMGLTQAVLGTFYLSLLTARPAKKK